MSRESTNVPAVDFRRNAIPFFEFGLSAYSLLVSSAQVVDHFLQLNGRPKVACFHILNRVACLGAVLRFRALKKPCPRV
jgi:hypothetical protein